MMPDQRPSSQYLDTLLLYCEEEIMGEAYFRALSRRFSQPDRTRKMDLMARVERHAADAMLPLVQRHGLMPRTDAALHDIGRREAEDTAQEWDAMIQSLRVSFPDYMPEFRALEAMAPPADRARLAFLTRHEVAAIEFLELEGRNRDGTEALLAYLRTAPPETTTAP